MKMKHKEWEVFREIGGVVIDKEVVEVPDHLVSDFIRYGWEKLETPMPIKTEDIKPSFRCKYCGAEFDNQGKLLQHYTKCEMRKQK